MLRSAFIAMTLAAAPAIAAPPVPSAPGPSGFETVVYRGIRLDVPRDWKYDDDALRRQINTTSEAAVRNAGIPISQANNDVVLSGSAPGRDGTKAATMRLSVRSAGGITQEDMRREMASMSKSDVEQLIRPILAQTEAALRTMPSVSYARAVTGRIERNASLV